MWKPFLHICLIVVFQKIKKSGGVIAIPNHHTFHCKRMHLIVSPPKPLSIVLQNGEYW
jgi:hypothetical protein